MKLPLKRSEKTMPNGLRVILIQKPGFSRSLFMFGIPAGGTSRVDITKGGLRPHRGGCAHYLEHQMFRLNGEDVTYPLAAVQAKSNAYTSYNETCYFVWTNSDPFEPLKLLISFVQTLDISAQSVEKEKGIILSEYQQYDQDPESRLLRESLRALYHHHPMREEILGLPEDISAMTPEDLQSFYETWYDPSQMVLVGVSGQDPEKLFEFIKEQEKNYPSIGPLAASAEHFWPEEPREVFQKTSETKMDIDLSYGCLAVKLDPVDDPKLAVRQDWMLNLWLTSQFSTLNPDYQNWIDTRLIGVMSGAEGDLSADHGYLLIYAQSDDVSRYLQTAKEVLERKQPVSEEVFESMMLKEKASSIRMLDQFEPLASQHVRGCFEQFDPLDDLSILDSITLDELNDYIDSLDVSRQSEIRVVPCMKKADSGDETAAGR